MSSFDNAPTNVQVIKLQPLSQPAEFWVAPSGKFAGQMFVPRRGEVLRVPNEYDEEGRVPFRTRSFPILSKKDLLAATQGFDGAAGSSWHDGWRHGPSARVAAAGGLAPFLSEFLASGGAVTGVAEAVTSLYYVSIDGPNGGDGTWIYPLSDPVQTLLDGLPPLSPSTQTWSALALLPLLCSSCLCVPATTRSWTWWATWCRRRQPWAVSISSSLWSAPTTSTRSAPRSTQPTWTARSRSRWGWTSSRRSAASTSATAPRSMRSAAGAASLMPTRATARRSRSSATGVLGLVRVRQGWLHINVRRACAQHSGRACTGGVGADAAVPLHSG